MMLLDDLILRDCVIDLALRTADLIGNAVLRTEGVPSLIRSEPNAYDEIRFIFQRIAFRCRTVKEPELILGETENACPFPIKKGLPGYERPETEATTAILI